ncbi:hypothetical protein NVP1168O_62 [Vibrio phage 1.168.O._10N.261.52.A10]|nr:hypothetical protein NVP1074O_60 [Vibrio phage 1.074.O._10N.222.49.B7]AUR92024.1 hypothetical protein NVP1168O_62 [Vibrio phage 1.168.O._10N.261.52.A10]
MSNVEKEMKYTFIHDADFDETGVIKIAHPESCSIKFESDESQRKVKLIRVLLEGEKPEPQKQYRYEKVDFVSDKEKAEAFIEGGLRYFTHGEVKGDLEHDTIPVTRLDELLCGNAIYRRVEIDHVEELAKEFHANVNNEIKASHPAWVTISWDEAPESDRNMHRVNAKHAIDKLGSN